MADAPFVICRCEKVKSLGEAGGVSAHATRERETPNADPDRTPLNRVILGSGRPLDDIKKRIEDSGVTVKKDAVLALDFFYGASPEYFRPNDRGRAGYWEEEKIGPWLERGLNWFRDYFGEENVVSAILHLDETTPHLSVQVVPVDTTPRQRGPAVRLNAARWTKTKEKLAALQTSVASYVEDIGLRRGKEKSGATHTTVKEFYAAMQASTAEVDAPVIPTPPMMNREAWAAEQTERVAEAMRPLAAAAEYHRTKAAAAEAEATRLRAERQALASRLRDLPLTQVAESLGMVRDTKDPAKWRAEGMAVSITGQKFFDQINAKGGGGAIDLVTQTTGWDFKRAVSWLAQNFGSERVEGAVMAHALAQPKKIVEEARRDLPVPYVHPVPAEDEWEHVRRYLVRERRLSEEWLDFLHDQGLVYAERRGAHINCVFKGAEASEKRSLTDDWKGLQPGSDKGGGGLCIHMGEESTRLVLVESAIDAISYAQMYGEKDMTIISTCGAIADSDYLKEADHTGMGIICAFDNDTAGDKMYDRIYEKYPQALRQKPIRGKDWNDSLKYFEMVGNMADTDMYNEVANSLNLKNIVTDKYLNHIESKLLPKIEIESQHETSMGPR